MNPPTLGLVLALIATVVLGVTDNIGDAETVTLLTGIVGLAVPSPIGRTPSNGA